MKSIMETHSVASVLNSALSNTTAYKKTFIGILIVEDEDFVREAAAEILRSCGYRVHAARNFTEAVELFHRYSDQLKLLLTDIVIPGRNGRELVNVLRGFSPQLKVLYISGYSENMITRQAALEANACYIPKPFSSHSLLKAIEIALGKDDSA